MGIKNFIKTKSSDKGIDQMDNFTLMLDGFIQEKLIAFQPESKILPIHEGDDLEVDYSL